MTQARKALAFKALHKSGAPIVLYNIWDAGGAKALAEAGAKAVATGSFSVAAAQGYGDGEKIPLELVLTLVKRITETTDLPVSVDFEGAYASDPATITANTRALIQAGAIGLNLEDQVVGSTNIYPLEEQAKRITAVRAAAEAEGIPLFINARTDLFLKSDPSEHETHLPEAIERAQAYAAAGADGFFAPALADLALLKKLCEASPLPVNAMIRGTLTSIADATSAGASRISYGPGPYASAMADLTQRFKALS
jgi:2-methylisocitrate lyase-like PEP mutase family enzyme